MDYLLKLDQRCHDAVALAAIAGDIERMRAYLRFFAITPEFIRINNNFILCAVAETRNTEMLDYLVDTFGLTIRDVTDDDNALILYAICHEHIDVLKWVFDRFDVKEGLQEFVLTAYEYNHAELADWLFTRLGLTKIVGTHADFGHILSRCNVETVKSLFTKLDFKKADLMAKNYTMFRSALVNPNVNTMLWVMFRFQLDRWEFANIIGDMDIPQDRLVYFASKYVVLMAE